MKVIDLIIKQFNYELEDKTMFRVLNQENHDKYIYNIDDNKFHEYRFGSGEMENISLVISSKTINWDIEIIEEYIKNKQVIDLDYVEKIIKGDEEEWIKFA